MARWACVIAVARITADSLICRFCEPSRFVSPVGTPDIALPAPLPVQGRQHEAFGDFCSSCSRDEFSFGLRDVDDFPQAMTCLAPSTMPGISAERDVKLTKDTTLSAISKAWIITNPPSSDAYFGVAASS